MSGSQCTHQWPGGGCDPDDGEFQFAGKLRRCDYRHACGLSVFSGTKSISSGNLTGDVITSGSTATTLTPSGVTPGSYSNANIAVDEKGRVTAASDGVGGQSSGVTPGSYTNANITVDVMGRVTAATNGSSGGEGGGGGNGGFEYPLFNLAAYSRNAAARGNVITPKQGNFTLNEIRCIWDSIAGVTYKVGVAPFNTTTRQFTSPPTYSAAFTEGGTGVGAKIHDFVFPSQPELADGTAYLLFLLRTDSATGAVVMYYHASTFIYYGLGPQASGASYYIASTDPAITDVWTKETGQYMIIPGAVLD